MPPTTDDYIKLLQQEGDFQSSGRFSMEAKKALEKMQDFRLQDPAEYILQLVSCAVRRGATQLQIELNGRDVRVGFDGEPFTAHELEQIFDCASQHSSHSLTASSAHLAIALQAMRTYNPDVLVVESYDSKGRNVLQLYEDQVWIETLPLPQSLPKITTYIGLEESLSMVKLCFATLVAKGRGERRLLRTAAYAAPIPVYLDGERLPFAIGHSPILLQGTGPAPIWVKNTKFVRSIKDQPCWGLACRTWDRQGKFVLVQAGICFQQQDEKRLKEYNVFLIEDRLRRDLSQRGIVADELRNQIVEAAVEVLS